MIASLAASLTCRLRGASFLATVVLAILCTPAAVADTITVNGATRYQTMKGWEAHARAWQVDKLRNAYDPSWKVQAPAIATRMVTELGINRIQVPLRSGWQNPVDYWGQFVAGALSYTEWKSHNYEKSGNAIQFSEFDFLIETSVLPMATALAARGEKLYVNLGYGDFNTTGFLQGSLSFAANPAAYATFVQAFFDRLKNKYGITADALELLNEPENTAWTATQIGQALVAAKARLVAAGYPGLNYIGPSPSSAGHMQTMANALLAVPGAAAALTTLSYHRYDSPGASAIGALDAYARSKGLQLDMSEWINATADTLYEDLTVGNVASWQKWAIADREEAGRTNPQAFYYLCDISTTPATITMAPNTALLAQYFRYVRLGAVRVGAQSSVAAQRPVAFINANGSYVVVVKTAAGTGARAVTVSGLPPGTYGVRRTTFAGQAADQADVVAAADGTATVTLSDGITTLYGKNGGTPPPPPPTAVGALSLAGTAAFASQAIGTSSAQKTIIVTNTGGTAVTVTGLSSSNPAEFSIVNSTCGLLNPGWDCTFGIVFKPGAAGARSSMITLASNGGGGPQTVSASGTGVTVTSPPPATGSLALVSSATFASQIIGTSSAAKTITVTNTGNAAVTVTSITTSNLAEFSIVNPTCGVLNPGVNCTFGIVFKPTATGTRSATITLANSASGGPKTLTASGVGLAVATPPTPPSTPPPATSPPTGTGALSFGGSAAFANQSVGTASTLKTITVTNVGSGPVTVTNITSSNSAEFAIASKACGLLNPGWDCTFSVVFKPSVVGARSATITLTGVGLGSTRTLSASGTGITPTGAPPATAPGTLTFTASTAFGNQKVGTKSTAKTIAITNAGGTAVTVTGITSSNTAEFPIMSNTCGVLKPGYHCVFSVLFAPKSAGGRSGTITIASNGVGGPQIINASGTGVTSASGSSDTIDLVEYRHSSWNHYFLTGSADEISKLDAGEFSGWARTGLRFNGVEKGDSGGIPVCRFFSTSFAPRSSHFYTAFADECVAVSANPDWILESTDVFNVQLPTDDGICPEDTDAVYRMYNNGLGGAPNHRYTIDGNVRAQMIEQGWIPEGYGAAGVIMCAPR